MNYRIVHVTRYEYHEWINLCHHEARLAPRNNARQTCLLSQIAVDPPPEAYREREDFFGNRVAYFAVQQPHTRMTVTATSEVRREVAVNQIDLFGGIAWEAAREALSGPSKNFDWLYARQFALESPLVGYANEAEQYAQVSFTPHRPLLEATHDLMRRIHEDFAFVPGFTNVSTPLSEVIEQRKGVCQDFAHFSLACLRSLGLAARYVSGYFETLPPPGSERLTGVDASHAWFSVFVPGSGWVDFDPTNNLMPGNKHITLAWGRDYLDVSPLKGVVFSAGKHDLHVSVDVIRTGG